MTENMLYYPHTLIVNQEGKAVNLVGNILEKIRNYFENKRKYKTAKENERGLLVLMGEMGN